MEFSSDLICGPASAHLIITYFLLRNFIASEYKTCIENDFTSCVPVLETSSNFFNISPINNVANSNNRFLGLLFTNYHCRVYIDVVAKEDAHHPSLVIYFSLANEHCKNSFAKSLSVIIF